MHGNRIIVWTGQVSIILLGQTMQTLSCLVTAPVPQGSPPHLGTGLLHSLWRFCTPLTHIWLQLDQAVHPDSPPLTAWRWKEWKNMLFLSRNSMQVLSRSELHHVFKHVRNFDDITTKKSCWYHRWFTCAMLMVQFRARQKLHTEFPTKNRPCKRSWKWQTLFSRPVNIQ